MARRGRSGAGGAGPRPRRPPLRRSLGQHHLRDGRRARPLVDHLRPEGRTVLEIGPGGGALTGLLIECGASRVVAVEIDPAWALRAAPDPRVRGVVADALGIAFERLPASWRVAGNLPYNVGTALLERLLTRAPAGIRAGFLLQREVVDRLVASAGEPAYGALSVLTAARAAVVRLGNLPAGAFVPAPRVESSFVGLELRPPPLPPERMVRLEEIVRGAFGQRRKTLRNALGAAFGRERAEAALARAGIAPGERAERLGLADFVALEEAFEALR